MSGYFIFGLQRSGTNYLQQLLSKNFQNYQYKNAGKQAWKHNIETWPKDKLERGQAVFIIHKNPYKWIESMSNRNQVDWNKKHADDQYCSLKTDETEDRYVIGRHEMDLIPLCLAYRDWAENWIIRTPNFIENRATKLRYESLLEYNTRIEFLDRTRRKYHLSRNGDWINPPIGSVPQSKDYSNDRDLYYKRHDKLDVLKRHHIDKINEILTIELIKKLGYNVL